MHSEDKLKSRFTFLDGKRTQHLNRCRECAKLTIPHLLPEQDDDHNTVLPTPYNDIGPQAVNHLAAKLWLTLFPPNSPFFKLGLTQKVLKELEAKSDGEVLKSDINAALGDIEQTIMEYIETHGVRSPAFVGIRQMVVTGNALAYTPPSEDENNHPWSTKGYGLKIFRLDQYVVVRDSVGNLVEGVIKESISLSAVPADIRDLVKDKMVTNKKSPTDDQEVALYTQILKNDEGEFDVTQEVEGILYEAGSETYTPEELPWLFLRWSQDSDYGRGIVEEYLGSFQSLESCTEAVVEGSLAAAKVIFLNNPNGTTRTKDLTKTRNCGFVSGLADDVSVLRVEKMHDFQTAEKLRTSIIQSISHAFLMNSSFQRSGERVTAEEIRTMAEELEDTLGGVYSVLSQEWQLPIVTLYMKRLKDGGSIPALPDGTIKPTITTGLEALGRNHEQAKLVSLIQETTALFGPEITARYISPGEYMKRSGTNKGIDTEGLVKSEEKVQAQLKQEQQSKAMADSAPGVAQEVAKGVVNKNG